MVNLQTYNYLKIVNLKRIGICFFLGTIISSVLTTIQGQEPYIRYAQEPDIETTPKTQEILNRFERRFVTMDSIIFYNPHVAPGELKFDSVFFEFNEAERVGEIDAEVAAKVSEMKNKTGLAFRGQAYVRPGAGISYDPDDPLVAYNAKFQAEINWNIFNSSIYKRGSKRKAIEIQGELDQLNFVKNDLDEQILYRRQL